jgi:hypothetical protein
MSAGPLFFKPFMSCKAIKRTYAENSNTTDLNGSTDKLLSKWKLEPAIIADYILIEKQQLMPQFAKKVSNYIPLHA